MSSFWQEIQQNHSNVHITLKQIAGKIYENVAPEVELDQFEETEIEEAIKLGFLLKEGEKLSFKEPEILKDYC